MGEDVRMRRSVTALVALVVGAGCLSSCGGGGAPAGAPAGAKPSETVRIYHEGDKTISIVFDVSGPGQVEITYAMHAGDKPTRRTVATPWTQTFQAAVAEPGLAPMLTARNTDPTATAGCQIVTSQLSMSGDKPPAPGAVAKCSVKVRVGR